jgi:sodium transport system permease protein
MKHVFDIFRKELKDILRDRRTVIFMVVVPTLAIPLIMYVTTELMTHFIEKLAAEKVKILVLNPEAAPDVITELEKRADPKGRAMRLAELLAARGLTEKELAGVKGDPQAFLKLLKKHDIDPRRLFEEVRGVVGRHEFDASPGSIITQAYPPNFEIVTAEEIGLKGLADPQNREQVLLDAVRKDRIAAAIAFEPEARKRLAGGESAEVTVYYLRSADRSAAAKGGLEKVFYLLGRQVVSKRLQAKGLPAGFARPFRLRPHKLPGPSPLVKLLSQMLPYMILIFAFLGATYPAIDLGAGEKERGTLETLLVAPVSRLAIVLGKFLVVLTAAVVSAVLATVSLAISLRLGVFAEMLQAGGADFSFSAVEAVAALLMVVPVSCIFSALLLALSIFAKTFKEGQSYAAPLQFAVILPAFVSFVPGVKLDWLMASLPVVNVSLALKEIFTGNLDQHWPHVGVIFASTSVFAGVMLLFAGWWFQRENVLFRS